MARQKSAFRDDLQFGGIFIAVGAAFGLLFGHGAIVGAVVGITTCALFVGVDWLRKWAAPSRHE
jgi:hypothetical protein